MIPLQLITAPLADNNSSTSSLQVSRMKASINGPNRRKNRAGDKTVASDFNATGKKNDVESSTRSTCNRNETQSMQFKVKSLERYLSSLKSSPGGGCHNVIGDACLFSVKADCDEWTCAGQQLLHQHFQMTTPESKHSNKKDLNESDPILIHFHDIPILIIRAIPVYDDTKKHDSTYYTQDDANILYLSQVHCHNHKICEDSIYSITCCSRIIQATEETKQYQNYDNLSAVGFEVFLRYSRTEHDNDNDEIENESESSMTGQLEEFNAKEINKQLIIHCLYSVLTVNECLVISINDKELVCRVSKVCIDRKSISEEEGEDDSDDTKKISAAEASLDDPYRGRVLFNTDFYIETSNPDAILIHGGRVLPESSLPQDVIHVTTSDDEWFPVRRILLAPCINLTKYVQYGKGKYKTDETNTTQQEKEKAARSPDAPEDGIHCKVNIDCCTFDRVLVFIMSQLYPEEYKFALELSETNALSLAAEELGLISLSDLCQSQLSSFESRVRKDKYIRFSEIQKRNENNELLIIVDGMVLDITRWIDEHPGGPSIIPSQALNIDCTCFFEMYHVSSASFLYLKSFYIGELHPASQLKKKDIKPSIGFLQSLRSYTDKWRVKIDEKVDETVHMNL